MKKLFTKLAITVFALIIAGIGSLTAADMMESASLILNSNNMVTGIAGGDDIIINASVTNKTASNLTVKFGFEIISLTPGQKPSFCWGTCYAPTDQNWPSGKAWQDEGGSIIPGSLGPNQTTSMNEVVLHISTTNYNFDTQELETIPGVSKVRFFFYNADDRNDSVSVTVTFDAKISGVNDEAENPDFDLLGMVPNPAVTNTTVHFNLPDNNYDVPFLEVWDSRGSRVIREDLCDCAHDKNIDVSKLPSGNYYMNIICDGKKTKAKALIIQR